jgi:hypothetical protein
LAGRFHAVFLKSQNGLTAPCAAAGRQRPFERFFQRESSRNFLISQQMSTFTPEIRIESAESARVPSGLVDSVARPGQLIDFY